tara:strand:- start:719 stop:883 length:165 start_codon:yes stop_codon:yes gene_type:complete
MLGRLGEYILRLFVEPTTKELSPELENDGRNYEDPGKIVRDYHDSTHGFGPWVD